MEQPNITKLSAIANQLRIHSITSTTAAGSGHPTSCLSAADIVAALFFSVMRYDPKNPKHPNNDRFILSKGHAAPVLYAAWAEAGLFPTDDLKNLRTFSSDLEGHPTPRLSCVDVATGSLGQGLSVGVGMALAARIDGLDYRTYVLLGDGEVAEGAVWEAASLAALHRLDNLVAVVDVNRLGQSQATAFGHDIEVYKRRFEAFGWHTLTVDGHTMGEILTAFGVAAMTRGRPTAIIARTVKGAGVLFVEDRDGWHGKALKVEEMERAVAELAPKAASAIDVRIVPPPDRIPDVHSPASFPPFSYAPGEMIATREAYGAALVRIGSVDTRIVALDGDTKNSTFSEKFAKAYPARFFECFIAEQNMVGMAVGLATQGKIPFASTFAAFFSRAGDQIRMAGPSMANIKLVGSHAGVSIGEDGPSQMGLEDLAFMRAVAGSVVLYPADAVATERLVEQLVLHRGIGFMRTTRPKTPVIYGNNEQFPIGGSKVVRQSENDRATVVAAGITLFEAIKAADRLREEGVNICVIDAYSIKPIDEGGLLTAVRRTNDTLITVEDHYSEGGLGDAVAGALSRHGVKVHKLAVTELPRSGKPEELLDHYRISSRSIIAKVKSLVM
jgi:transketolase